MTSTQPNVLITGGSRGLGLALAAELAAAGSSVVIVARHPTALSTAVHSLTDRGFDVHGISADIGDKHAIAEIAGRAASLIGDIDVLVNNASTLGPTPLRLLLDTDCEDLEQVLSVNLVGPFRLTKVIAGHMALRGSGTVINISSDAAVNSYATWGAYSASKIALDHLTRIWAEEIGELGVRFFSVDPGEMNTQMHADALPDAETTNLADPQNVARRIARLIRVPVHPVVRLTAADIGVAS